MIRLILIFVAVAGAVSLGLYLSDHPGHVTVAWDGYQIDMSLTLALGVFAAGVFVAWFLLTFIWRVLTAPGRFRARRRTRQHFDAYRALTDGLVAIAAGDARSAAFERHKAEKLFAAAGEKIPAINRLIAAQTALLNGDADGAEAEFRLMLDNPETAFLGLRGLVVQAMKAGRESDVRSLIAQAASLRPATPWVMRAQIALEARSANWREAQSFVREAAKRGAITDLTAKHNKATLLVARSLAAVAAQDPREALKVAAQAHGVDPSFVPAACHYAKLLHDQGKRDKGLKVIETAWAETGHPDLAVAYRALLAKESATERLARTARLATLRPNDPEADLALADAALVAKNWEEARRYLARAGSGKPSGWRARLCALMIALEQGQGKDPAAVATWQDRLAKAPGEHLWACESCGHETAQWAPLCPSCHGFDGFVWQAGHLSPDQAGAYPGDYRIDGLMPPGGPAPQVDLAAVASGYGHAPSRHHLTPTP